MPSRPVHSHELPEAKCRGLRCDRCKNMIAQMLAKTYGCFPHTEHSFDVETHWEAYAGMEAGLPLKRIYKALVRHRGFESFVRSRKLRRCDLFLPNANLSVEIDEDQHFTAARRVALMKYPDNLELGFSRSRWMKLCSSINAHDNDPPFRDEQRAWYDTLRDFLPLLQPNLFPKLKPIVRIYVRDYAWCSLNPDSNKDRTLFRKLIKPNGFQKG